jgi:hypothetical protein
MLDKVLAVISLAAFIGFLVVVVTFVGRMNLTIVVIIVIAMAIYDFWREFRNQARPK